ncbi:hypothetical protein V2J09_012948 [Rumex salicifolius]
MCGIALIVCGVRVDISTVSSQQVSPAVNAEQCVFTVEELKAALSRRGPDSLGSKRVLLRNGSPFMHDQQLSSASVSEEGPNCEESRIRSILNSAADGESRYRTSNIMAEMQFIGAELQLRGTHPIQQPLTDPFANVLAYNGEIYGGLDLNGDDNDTEALMDALCNCCSCYLHEDGRNKIPELLSLIKGPWALIYWQDSTRTLWFGRDALGRRSLLVHWPTSEDTRFLLSSVSPESSMDAEVKSGSSGINYWEELPCGVYSLTIDASSVNECLSGKVRKHEWTSPLLNELIRWEREFVEPNDRDFHSSSSPTSAREYNILRASANGTSQPAILAPVHTVLDALRKSVARRTIENAIFEVKDDHKKEQSVPVAVLFSGGVDSMILAAVLHECLDAKYVIDLLNVSFEGDSAPDRLTGRAGLKELKRISPQRSWRLVEIDADLSNLSLEMKHVMSLINPAKTYMDLNIGLALWLAAGGDGVVFENGDNSYKCAKYKSEARILLVGSGADEQCAGYGRHRTKYRSSGWIGLNEEMKLDMQRIWKRNLGRDDRCIADNGKEARFPFLDEDVIRILLGFPLWEIANLDQPSGTGDKKILREVAKLLGLHEAATLPKRAIQFGTRIAQESNKKNFGSNRAANQASAGSAVINS